MCRLVSYNVANLNSKLKFGNFFTYINKFDIFFLFETHVLADNRIHFSSFFKNYVLYWVDATKNHSSGRAIGGGLYGFKKTIQKKYFLKFCEFPNGVTLSAKFNDVCFHFIPRYINCTSWSSDFDKFEDFIYSFNGSSFCIIGDLNARVSDAQILDETMLFDTPLISQCRISKDKILDSKGKKLLTLVENVGGIIVNGRMAGDVKGEYTFCGVMGSSIIDYCICSLDVLKLIFDFHIPSKPFSDHMPCTVSLCSKNNPLTKELSLPQKLPWLPKNLVRYTDALNRLANSEYLHSSLSIHEKVFICTNKIHTANGNNCFKTRFDPKNKWFDSQCENARKSMLDKLDQYRKSNTEIRRRCYIDSRSRYARLCDQKKLGFKMDNILKLNGVRNSSEWWKLANSLRNCKPKVGNNLSISHFCEYFNSLLSQEDFDCDILLSSVNIIDPFLDSPLEMRELDLVIKAAKLNKAPGQDRISYEFYKNSPLCFLNEVLSLFNVIFLKEEIRTLFVIRLLYHYLKKEI